MIACDGILPHLTLLLLLQLLLEIFVEFFSSLLDLDLGFRTKVDLGQQVDEGEHRCHQESACVHI